MNALGTATVNSINTSFHSRISSTKQISKSFRYQFRVIYSSLWCHCLPKKRYVLLCLRRTVFSFVRSFCTLHKPIAVSYSFIWRAPTIGITRAIASNCIAKSGRKKGSVFYFLSSVYSQCFPTCIPSTTSFFKTLVVSSSLHASSCN